MLEYHGVYLPPPAEAVVSPNGDGVADTQRLSLKVVRASTVNVTMTSPDGSVVRRETRELQPGVHEIAFPPSARALHASSARQGVPADGRWTLSASAIDEQGLSSSHARRFTVNSTLGFLAVAPRRMVLRRTGGATTIAWAQARAARVWVTIRNLAGTVVRRVLSRRLEPGGQRVVWNGRLANGELAPGGRFVVVLTATNELGTVVLERPLVVRRAK
jgi:surface antigen